MSCKKIVLLSLVLFQAITLCGQRVEFTYDDNGNRLTRTLIVEQLQSQTVQFPIVDPKSLKTSKNAITTGSTPTLQNDESSLSSKVDSLRQSKNKRILPEEGEIVTVVYPNPNIGLIKIDISNMPLNSINEMRLYNLSGSELTIRRNFESHSEIDISSLQDGLYILRIKINEKIFDWKIVKNHY